MSYLEKPGQRHRHTKEGKRQGQHVRVQVAQDEAERRRFDDWLQPLLGPAGEVILMDDA